MAQTDHKAVVQYAGDQFFIGTTPSGNSQTIDSKGDRSSAASPLELLMLSVASCTAVDVVSILKKKRQEITDYKVEIEGDRRDEFPRGFTAFRVHHIVYGRSVSEDAVAKAVELSDDKYCSVAYTVRPGAEITTSFEVVEVGED
ncbi:MAG: OsmC family protein [Pyrinomonadaceae bacterium]|nr:OsmC family protein [Pyrinomonadaceae bacterium]